MFLGLHLACCWEKAWIEPKMATKLGLTLAWNCEHSSRSLPLCSLMTSSCNWWQLKLFRGRTSIYGKHQQHSNPADVYKSLRVTRLFAAVFEIFTADCGTVQIAGIETMWELHTLTVMNCWWNPSGYEASNYLGLKLFMDLHEQSTNQIFLKKK